MFFKRIKHNVILSWLRPLRIDTEQSSTMSPLQKPPKLTTSESVLNFRPYELLVVLMAVACKNFAFCMRALLCACVLAPASFATICLIHSPPSWNHNQPIGIFVLVHSNNLTFRILPSFITASKRPHIVYHKSMQLSFLFRRWQCNLLSNGNTPGLVEMNFSFSWYGFQASRLLDMLPYCWIIIHDKGKLGITSVM